MAARAVPGDLSPPGTREQDSITAGSGTIDHFPTASRRVFPALKVGTVEAAMVMGSPVCGLRPCLAARARGVNVPNPAIATLSPLARVSVMVENTASMTLSAPALDREASAATRDESSDLFMRCLLGG